MARGKAKPWSFSATGFATWFLRDTEGNRRRLKRATQAGLKEALKWWRDKQLPKHFQPGAGRTWGYAKRSEGYLKQKQRLIQRHGGARGGERRAAGPARCGATGAGFAGAGARAGRSCNRA